MATFEQIQEEIASMLSLPDEELDERQRAAMDEYLNELGDMEAAKVDGFAQFVKLQSDLVEACRAEAARLYQKAKTAENRIGDLKRRYLEIMASHHLKKVRGNAYTISVGTNAEVAAPRDQEFLEALFAERPDLVNRKVEFVANKKAMKKLLEAGEEIPCCMLVPTSHLRVR